jgi:iron complex transport system substrate-binding protein
MLLLLVSCRSPAPAQRSGGIISLVPSATEILFELGAGDRVVGVSDFCTHPPAARDLPRYGGFLNPSTERILSSGARTVVLVHTANKLIRTCRDAGLNVVTVKTNNLHDMDDAIAALGVLVGRQAEAEALTARIHEEIADAAASAPGGPSPEVVVIVDRAPDDLKRLFVAGPDSLLDDLVTRVGGRNAFSDAPRMYPMVTLETIVARGPDVIIDLRPLERSGPASLEKARWLWKRSGILAPDGPIASVHVLEATDLTVYGPRLGQACRTLADAIHGGGP